MRPPRRAWHRASGLAVRSASARQASAGWPAAAVLAAAASRREAARGRWQPLRGFCGSRTLGAVVRELQKQGRLSAALEGSRQSRAEPGLGFVDIDAELAKEAEVEGLEEEAPEYEAAAFGGARGFLHSDELDGRAEAEDPAGSDGDLEAASHHRRHAVEDVSLLSEEELRERVRRSIEELVPSDTSSATHEGPATVDTEGLTPAQIFYLENRERLVSRAQEYYVEKQKELLQQQESPLDVEEEWRFYHEPVVRPPKGHLWSISGDGQPEEHGLEEGWRETVEEWPKGQLPTVEMIAELLRAEQARDVDIIDFDECGRRDIGTHGIVCTGITTRHCRRLGDIAARATQTVQAPHINAFCYGTRKDEWVVAHCGPIKVHIFTAETRREYDIQLLWRHPEEFFLPGDFPHYYEVYTTAAEAFRLPSGHVTRPSGSRGHSPVPAPFRDSLHAALMQPDYDAAEDARYATPALVREVGGDERRAAWPQDDLGSRASASWPSSSSRGPATGGEEDDTDGEVEGEEGSWPASASSGRGGQAWPTGTGWGSDHEAETDEEEEDADGGPAWELGARGADKQAAEELPRVGALGVKPVGHGQGLPASEERVSEREGSHEADDERKPLKGL